MIHTGNVGYCKQISCEFIVALTALTLSSGWHRGPLIRLFNTSSVLVDRTCAQSCVVGAIVDYTNVTFGHRLLMPSVNEPK